MQFELEDFKLKCKKTWSDDVNETLTYACYSLAYGYRSNIEESLYDCADLKTPIYNHELFSAVPYIDEYIENGIEEGMIEINPKTFSLAKLAQQGYYLLINEALYENLEAIIYNHVFDYVNQQDAVKKLAKADERAKELEAELNYLIGEALDYYYQCSFDDLDRRADDIITEILEDNVEDGKEDEEE